MPIQVRSDRDETDMEAKDIRVIKWEGNKEGKGGGEIEACIHAWRPSIWFWTLNFGFMWCVLGWVVLFLYLFFLVVVVVVMYIGTYSLPCYAMLCYAILCISYSMYDKRKKEDDDSDSDLDLGIGCQLFSLSLSHTHSDVKCTYIIHRLRYQSR